MDWCLDTGVPGALGLVEQEMADHLTRHAVEPQTVELARPLFHDALRRQSGTALWATLDWSGRVCRLRVRPLRDRELVGRSIGDGATVASDAARQLITDYRDGSTDITVELPVARREERDIDPAPAEAAAMPDTEPARLLGLVSADLYSGRTLDEAAARAGASVAAAEASEDGAGPGDVEGVVRQFLAAEDRLGGDFELLSVEGSRAVLRNRRCPFGPSTSPSMCRFTSALAGGLGARLSGYADVALYQTLAAGDSECRMVLDTGGGLERAVSHRYRWPHPPPSGPGEPEQRNPGGPGFQVRIMMELPRDRMTVPVTRHLVRAAMNEIGVLTDDRDAVELAVTEACANVIDHSGPGDAYEVSVAIGPSACHIRVVDVGRGFDHTALDEPQMASGDAEHGRGVALMHALVDQVRFESEPEKGTVVHLVKQLAFRDDAPIRRLLGRRDEGPPTEESPAG
jgi:serine/threonine-protein kinase RsbW